MTSGCLDDGAAVQEPPSLVFVDIELTEQAASDSPQNRINLAGPPVLPEGSYRPHACRVRRRFPDR